MLELLLLQSFWFIASAYASNGFPPLMRGRMPIDGGKKFRGRRLLGDGKTWEGLIGGIVFGVFIGSLQIFGQDYLPPELLLPKMTFPMVFDIFWPLAVIYPCTKRVVGRDNPADKRNAGQYTA